MMIDIEQQIKQFPFLLDIQLKVIEVHFLVEICFPGSVLHP